MAKHNNPNILSFDADVIVFCGELRAMINLRYGKFCVYCPFIRADWSNGA